MKKLSALLLSLLLLLTACDTPATPGDAVTLPTPNDEILVEEGLHAEDLPEVCRLWFDLAETSGAADKNSKLPLASRADEGACDYLAVRLPGGTPQLFTTPKADRSSSGMAIPYPQHPEQEKAAKRPRSRRFAAF